MSYSEDDDSESDLAEDFDDDSVTLPCPYCAAAVYEDAPRCPECGEYLSAETSPAARQPWWIIIGALAAMYAIYRGLLG